MRLNKFTTLIVTGVFLALGAGAAVAQQSQEQGGSMQPQQQAPTQPQQQPNQSGMSAFSSTEKEFLSKSAQDSLLEFASAQLAVQKAQNAQVVDYALRLMDDHAQYNKQLMQLAREKQVEIPVTLDKKGRSQIKRLMRLQGSEFDRQYTQEVAQANQSDLKDLQRASTSIKDPDIQAFINQTLPVQQQHLQLSQELQTSSTSGATGTNSK